MPYTCSFTCPRTIELHITGHKFIYPQPIIKVKARKLKNDDKKNKNLGAVSKNPIRSDKEYTWPRHRGPGQDPRELSKKLNIQVILKLPFSKISSILLTLRKPFHLILRISRFISPGVSAMASDKLYPQK